ncbi:phosphoglycerate mutase (2,3-diphosphoglycerate-independent) [Candidatus Roizmanbacteria bacterium RIFCSPLOWO2_01_FULL_42_14]|uniref:2,3-bisphosphoglycerate-independent phosphoglycerate mutase n=1 Tax=Candidatus Roizmanbacteria bacterium RIFCSPLOWO2_01_FULL_42_14 TaxID=1802068 RepID=A0A1F7J7I2_9BACT|nr:MAG: phosphoglycerate mutase (2,3-diphosphoglycerate-independent) [Candidatus Roizmanbacteria bacterium RIFCSPLOWO2_01_FULL_42_14]
MKGVVLVIFDGLGIAQPGPSNAFTEAHPQNFDTLMRSYPHTQLKASGEAVGLPANEVGSTEVGHINIGAGKIVYQSLPRINLSIADGTYFTNPAFKRAVEHVKKHSSQLHLLGLLGNGTVHASTAHLFALLFLCKENGLQNVNLHLITDGRDSPPKAAATYLEDVQNKLDQLNIGKIASVIGRYYAMDRDHRWERTEKAYRCLVMGEGKTAISWKQAVENAYNSNTTDEFIEPTLIVPNGDQPVLIKPNDSVIFYNFRIDRPRQLTKAFVLENFERDANKISFDPYRVKYEKKHTVDEEQLTPPFKRGDKVPNLMFVMMTQYEQDLPSDVAFPPSIVNMPLGRVLSENGIPQLRMSESEKERFVTHYFNGLRTPPLPMEDRIIIPSPKVATYDLKPEMSAREITDTLVQKIQQGTYKFILVNYANPDMVGHTGNLQAAISAVQVSDECLGRIAQAILDNNYALIVTADHGNVEEMIDLRTGGISTEHSGNPVPFIAISKNLQGNPRTLETGILADIAPTILSLLGIAPPQDMTGRNLLQDLEMASS